MAVLHEIFNNPFAKRALAQVDLLNDQDGIEIFDKRRTR